MNWRRKEKAPGTSISLRKTVAGLFSILSNMTPWSTLRALGTYPATKLTVFIPLIGYLILFNENILHYLALSKQLFGQTQEQIASVPAPVSVRLLLLYFGLCLIAAGSVIFTLRCPPRLKAYGSAPEFIGKELDNISIVELCAISECLDPKGAVGGKFREYCSKLVERYTSNYVSPVQAKRDEEIEADGLNAYFQILDRGRPISRVGSASLFVAGLVALSIPSAEVFFRVVWLLIRTIRTYF
jgi:hypothetical protein